MTVFTLLLLALVQRAPDQPVNPGIARLFPAEFPGYVFDSAHVLTNAPALWARIERLKADTRGVIMVVTLPSLGDYAASDVAMTAGRLWKVGGQGEVGSVTRSLGAVILVVPKTPASGNRGSCFIAPAADAQGFITDGTAGAWCRSAVPAFKENQYDAGVTMLVNAVETGMREEVRRASLPPPPPRDYSGLVNTLLFLVIGLPVLWGLVSLVTAPYRRREAEARRKRDMERQRWQDEQNRIRRKLDDERAAQLAQQRRQAEAAERARWNGLTREQQEAETAARARAAEEAAARRKRQQDDDDDRRRSSYSSDSGSSSSGSSSTSYDSGGGGSYDGGGGGSSW